MQFRGKRLTLSGVDTGRNYFDLNGLTYEALPLNINDSRAGIGFNSSVFIARRADDGMEFAVKISSFAEISPPHQRAVRFRREIEALKKARDNNKLEFVLQLVDDGIIQIEGSDYQCFISELADRTLDIFLKDNPDIIMQQRLLLCFDIHKCISALHDIGIYHRDIKPENILHVNDRWKIGDLGLIQYRNNDVELDTVREKIGPANFMTPEAINKSNWIVRSDNSFIDTAFCGRSDVFQLGKLFWYIIQGDVPNGCLKSSDLEVASDDVYGGFLKPMLRYKREDRPTLDDVGARMIPLQRRYQF